MVRAAGRPLGRIPLLIRGLSGSVASVAHLVRSDSDGTFCWPEAPAGVYSVVAVAPGFSPVVHQILHRAGDRIVSFVRFDLEQDKLGVVPAAPGGALDPWAARAATSGDVLREALPAPEAPTTRTSSLAEPRSSAAASLPVRATLSSVQGFGAQGTGAVSETAIEMRGRVGQGFRWGVEGAYQSTSASSGVPSGEGSRLAIDVLPSDDQEIRVSTRRQSWSPSRLAQHAVDWSGATGESSRASVSARVVNQENAPDHALAGLFPGSSSSLEVTARYQTDLDRDKFVRVLVGYRAGDDTLTPSSAQAGREARVGGVAGVRLFDRLLVEGGGTGEFSAVVRGVTPEVGLRLEAATGLVFFGFASHRFDRREGEGFARSYVGWDPSELVRATSSLYRAGVRLSSTAAGSFEVEATRRQLGDNFQLILDPESFDRLDALVLLAGDLADELSSSVLVAVAPGLPARFSVQVGRIHGDHPELLTQNEARYLTSGASLALSPTGTSLSLRYRAWEQALGLLRAERATGSEAVDLSVSQALPIPFLESWGSEWRALFSLEVGRRDEGDGQSRVNRRMAGGLSLAF